MNPIERLSLPAGASPSVGHERVLAAAIAANTPLRGPGIRHRRRPWGVSTSYIGGLGGGATSDIFEPTVTRVAGGIGVSWLRGLIAGIEPTIGGVPISGIPPNGKAPVYTIPADAFSVQGQALVYFRLTLEHSSWFPAAGTGADGAARAAIETVAFASVPPAELFTQFKLCAIVNQAGNLVHRPLYSNFGFMAVNRKSNGASFPLFWPLT